MRYTCSAGGNDEPKRRAQEEVPVTGLISVILTTYQREDALDVVLRALSRQTDRAFEVMAPVRRRVPWSSAG
jgi:hypothetical protein